ncbi:MAG: PAS domain S-box protein, partial [Gammaproteobacteria bacterium]|nr:PAS domain S-box protein [Gammaproteobacteria bacterium]
MANFFHKIQIEQVKLLYHQIKFALWAEAFAAISLSLVLWGKMNPYLITSWLLFNLIICGFARHLLVYIFQRSISHTTLSYEKALFWLKLFTIGAFLSGISWGLSGSALMLKEDMARQTFMVFLLFGVTAAANPFYSPNFRVYSAFLLPAFLPFTAWLLLQGGIFIILSMLACIYIIIMLATSYYSFHLIATSLHLRFENNNLLENLSGTMSSLENRKQELEKSLSLVRTTFESSIDGILVLNAENKIEDFNKKFIDMWRLSPTFLKHRSLKILSNYAYDQLIDPADFSKKLSDNILHDEERFDEVLFKDGRIFELYSHPQRLGDVISGRVFTFRDVTGRKLMEAKLFYQANFDPLTGLPNRTLV